MARGGRAGGFLPWLAGRGSGRDDPRAGKVSVLVGGLGCATRTKCRVGALQQGAHSGHSNLDPTPARQHPRLPCGVGGAFVMSGRSAEADR